MSVFHDTINALSSTTPPLHQAVANANSAMHAARGHLSDALDHLGNDFQQALHDKASAERALSEANNRVDELRAAALHLSQVGANIENILGIGQEVIEGNTADIPQAVESVENAAHEVQEAESNLVEFSRRDS